MTGNEENIEFDLNNKEEGGFRCYKMVVKILNKDKIRHQNIDIYTSGLKKLFEMRRIHNAIFPADRELIYANLRSN